MTHIFPYRVRVVEHGVLTEGRQQDRASKLRRNMEFGDNESAPQPMPSSPTPKGNPMTETSGRTAYPGIVRAALEIAYDNGGINRNRSEKKMKGEFERWLAKQPADILPAIDAWLTGLSDEDLNTVCAGEESEQQALLQSAPPFTDKLLNDYFDEVC